MLLRSITSACLLAILALSPSAGHAQDGGMTCESILANAEKGGMETYMAVSTLFHGKHMGVPCGKPDYDRAYALAQQVNSSVAPWAKILRARAASGHPPAASAIARLGL